MFLYRLLFISILALAVSGCSSKSWNWTWFFEDDEEELVYEEVMDDGEFIEEEFDEDAMIDVVYDLQQICDDLNAGRSLSGAVAADVEALCNKLSVDGSMRVEMVYEDEMDGEDGMMMEEDEYRDEPPRRGPRYRDRDYEDKPPSRRDTAMGDDGMPPKRTVLHFGYKQSRLGPRDIAKLERHAEFLQSNPDMVVTVEGHTDTVASASYNKKLGMRRARMVGDLLEEMGVNSDQIVTISYGEERPLDSGSSEAAQARNRRVELVY